MTQSYISTTSYRDMYDKRPTLIFFKDNNYSVISRFLLNCSNIRITAFI